ncbi:MAG: hypothetical protein ACK4MV_15485 [Beijerinckiaceae bacterium]
MRFPVLAAMLFCASAALAQQAPDWRATLEEHYRIDIAFDACKDVTPSAADMLRLEAAIAYVEEKSGLAEDELDEMYGDAERDAVKLDEFCKRMADAVARVQNIPKDYR